MALSNEKAAVEYVADVFEADGLGAPFKVKLHNAVTVVEDPDTGEIVSYSIPDVPQLLILAMITRLTCSRKLSGADIKFVRKVLGLKQKDFAKKLDLSVEHLSRCENGGPPLSPQGDKYLRVFSISSALKLPDAPKNDAERELQSFLDQVFDGMDIRSAHGADDEISLNFVRSTACEEDSSHGPNGAGGWLKNQDGLAA